MIGISLDSVIGMSLERVIAMPWNTHRPDPQEGAHAHGGAS